MKEESILKDRKIKPTAARLLVLRELMEIDKAVSLKDLEQILVHSDKSTIFRTLKTFEQQKLIHSIADGSGVTKYALCLAKYQNLVICCIINYSAQKFQSSATLGGSYIGQTERCAQGQAETDSESNARPPNTTERYES